MQGPDPPVVILHLSPSWSLLFPPPIIHQSEEKEDVVPTSIEDIQHLEALD
eukprot:CAMPEP_0195285888 /NCGR_PEP_ID=MMETSP0707-20130614/3561_1 /TAXON_ID=33640 /ORGANISM="Asterionellopsis glacialis, Strain CCMP134" /LENGTH=50 /DNA_ID=CAMNT_0040345457 /DNA_START=799 /DNA_END=948 /DNA_ORIENTATION=-